MNGPHSEATKKKISESRKGKTVGHPFWGRKHTEEEKLKIAEASKKHWKDKGYREKVMTTVAEALKRPEVSARRSFLMSGNNNPNWVEDRSKLIRKQERNDSAYKDWRKSVRDRDGWQCKMANGDCLGKVVAHHILPWAKFPELRYEIKNGITLCRFHHPRTRKGEMELSPYLQDLVLKGN